MVAHHRGSPRCPSQHHDQGHVSAEMGGSTWLAFLKHHEGFKNIPINLTLTQLHHPRNLSWVGEKGRPTWVPVRGFFLWTPFVTFVTRRKRFWDLLSYYSYPMRQDVKPSLSFYFQALGTQQRWRETRPLPSRSYLQRGEINTELLVTYLLLFLDLLFCF